MSSEQIVRNTSAHVAPIPEGNLFTALIASSVPDTQPTFIRADGKVYTRAEIIRLSRRLAWTFVHRLGLRPGNRVAILSANSVYVPIVFYACFIARLVVVPISYSLVAQEVAPLVADSKPTVILASPAALDTARQAAGKSIPLWTMSDQDEYGEDDIRSLLTDAEFDPLPVADAAQEVAVIAYSSGTTGKAKGALLTHRNFSAQLVQCVAVIDSYCRRGDVTAAFLPLGHAMGLIKYILYTFHIGVATLVLPRFDLRQLLAAISRYQVRYIFAPPPVVVLLAKDPVVDEYDISSLRGLLVGAAPLSQSLSEAIETRLPAVKVSQGAGMSETTSVTTMSMPPGYLYQGSAGKICPLTEIRLVNDQGEDVAFTTDPSTGRSYRGEIWIRAPTVFKGYLNNPQATKEIMEGDWLKSGDVGEHRDGFIWYVDRTKELIKHKGYQVAPSELEALLLEHPDVSDAAVVGVYDEKQATELPRAFIVPSQRNGKADLAKEVREWVDKRVSTHKRLRGGVYILSAIPKSPSGKILRRLLRDQPLTAKL